MSQSYGTVKGQSILSEESRITLPAKLESFGVFPERPPVHKDDTDRRLYPHHLFSLFTAEIIERKVIFTR
jgi:hypothetical protein